VISRAFTALADFAALGLPFLTSGGSLLAMKGPQAEHHHEIEAIGDDGTLVLAGTRFKIQIHRYTLPVLGDERRLVRLTRV
jgi:16S rRNA G527 N7-methylase RsmG